MSNRPPRATEKQIAYIEQLCRRQGIDLESPVTSEMIANGRPKPRIVKARATMQLHWREWSKAEASQFLDWLTKLQFVENR